MKMTPSEESMKEAKQIYDELVTKANLGATSEGWQVHVIAKALDRYKAEIERLKSDVEVLKGALGYSVSGDTLTKLSDGSYPICGMCDAKHNENSSLKAEIKRLENSKIIVYGSNQLKDVAHLLNLQEEISTLQAQIKEKDEELQVYKDDLKTEMGNTGGLQLEVDSLKSKLEKAREALQSLYDEQNGPPLIKHEKCWNDAMKQAQEVLEQIGEDGIEALEQVNKLFKAKDEEISALKKEATVRILALQKEVEELKRKVEIARSALQELNKFDDFWVAKEALEKLGGEKG